MAAFNRHPFLTSFYITAPAAPAALAALAVIPAALAVAPAYGTGCSRLRNRNIPSRMLVTTMTPLAKNG